MIRNWLALLMIDLRLSLLMALVFAVPQSSLAVEPARVPQRVADNRPQYRTAQTGNSAARYSPDFEPLPPVPEVDTAPPNAQPTLARQPAANMRLPQPGSEEVQARAPVTLAELQDIALANNPTLLQAAASVDSARGEWVQVGLYPNPNIAYLGTQIADKGTPGQQGAYFEQQFVRGRKLPLNRAVAEREIAMAQQQFEAQRMRVLNDVRIQFYNTLIAQRTLEISQELVDLSERASKAAGELFNAQEVSRVDVLQARIEVNSARFALVNAQNRQQAAWRRLSALVGSPAMQQRPLQGDLQADMPSFTWDEAMNRILVESPELASTRIGVDRSLSALRRARVEPVPNLTVQAGPQYDIGAQEMISNVNVVLPVPLFNYNQGNVRKAEAEVRASRAEVSRMELVLTTRLAGAFERYASARNQVEQFREEILPDALEALNLVTAGYRQGELSFLVLLTAQRTYFFTTLAYFEAQRQLWESALAIDGLLLVDSLNTGSGATESTSGPTIQPVFALPFMGR